MNVGEFGVVFRMGVSFDISGEDSLSLTFTKPDGTTLVVSSGVGVGATTVVTPAGTMLAHQYATYTFLPGDVDQSGSWSSRLTYIDDIGARKLISLPGTFTVLP